MSQQALIFQQTGGQGTIQHRVGFVLSIEIFTLFDFRKSALVVGLAGKFEDPIGIDIGCGLRLTDRIRRETNSGDFGFAEQVVAFPSTFTIVDGGELLTDDLFGEGA